MGRFLLCLSAVVAVPGFDLAQEPAGPKLLIAFASVRDRRAPPYPKGYFYEHDGVASGQLLGSGDSIEKGINATRSDMRPWLSGAGRYSAFSAPLGRTGGVRSD